MFQHDIYQKYDLLLPTKFEGGYLIILLFEKIKAGEIEEFFTTKEVNEILLQISKAFNQESIPQWNRIKEPLFHYFIRNHPEEPWKYYLTDYAKSVVELMQNKLQNPYKNHPLKKSFDDVFTLKSDDIKSIDDLELKFGRLFIQGSKKIIIDHLESLEDELRNSYKELNQILRNDSASAVKLVKEFTVVFKKFGSKADDITESIITKDRFLVMLQSIVDKFYSKILSGESRNNITENLYTEWEKAREIYIDIKDFFNTIDNKVSLIRKQINYASSKLSELHEQFSARANFRLQIRKLHEEALKNTIYHDGDMLFINSFPLKSLVYENTRILFPKRHDYGDKRPNELEQMESDQAYCDAETKKIEEEIIQQQKVNIWVDEAKLLLEQRANISLDEFINMVGTQEKDVQIAYQVAAELISYISEDAAVSVDIKQEVIFIKEQDIALWKMTMKKE